MQNKATKLIYLYCKYKMIYVRIDEE